MIVLDFIIANEDRHFNNFGLVRNAVTLEWIGAAPIFDCGTSLWYNTQESRIKPLAPSLQGKPFKKNACRTNSSGQGFFMDRSKCT